MAKADPERHSLRVGLTGGIASGKSTVARLLAEAGCTVTDADRMVAELYQPGAAGAAAVAELFGSEYLDAGGAVDRDKVAALVFADKEARRELESRIHPLVGQRFAALIESSDGIVVFEVPLMAETGGGSNYDAVITVEADEQLRLDRAVDRGHERLDAVARMNAQATREQREAIADFVLDNNGSLVQLQAQVEAVVAELEKQLAQQADVSD